ncbi:hypothetical protein LZ554_001378 [Drepanopeziza brunnea f. sp. 'monogermtubi']|nr:hypothetical protein LZ554_001378 [Drepanopeziza brunnea f. sp. 'monogermtubi']
MGLPLFKTPIQPEVASKAAEKTAAGPRSSIRRQRAMRVPHPHPRIAEARRRRILGMEPEDDDLPETQRPSYSLETEITFSESPQMRTLRMLDEQRVRARDPLSFERQRTSNGEDGPLMPPVPESRDYAGDVRERQREVHRVRQMGQELRRMGRRSHAATPPYTDSDLVYLSRTDPPRLSTSLTPVLSPSHQPTRRSDSPPRRNLEEPDSSFPFTFSGSSHTETPERVHALNQSASNRERLRRLARQARLDGLGDRDRSLSPEGGAAWDTLLTSITPDPQPPSAGSSFVSTSAAAAAATSSGSSSTRVEHECEVSDGSHTDDDEEPYYRLQDYSGNRRDRFWRSYAEVVTANLDRGSRNETDHLTRGIHGMISRIARRDDVPET